jgi:hypothetical protein
MKTDSAQSPPPFRTRLSVLFAGGARKAVILRRGPRTHYCLIAWDLASDTFTPGQWMKGLVELCDLSPDGSLLAYWAAQYHPSARWQRTSGTLSSVAVERGAFEPLKQSSVQRGRKARKVPRYMRDQQASARRVPAKNMGVWTAISPVPYFSALALWPAFGHWTGGARFASANRIAVYEPESRMVPAVNVVMPPMVHAVSAFSTAASQWPAGCSSHGPSLPMYDMCYPHPKRDSHRCCEFEKILKACGLHDVDWVHFDTNGDMLFAGDGAIYRLSRWETIPSTDYVRAARKLAEFSGMIFQLVRAPSEKMRWIV